MIALTTCFLELVELKKERKLVCQRMDASNGHLFFMRRLGEIDHYIDVYEAEVGERNK